MYITIRFVSYLCVFACVRLSNKVQGQETDVANKTRLANKLPGQNPLEVVLDTEALEGPPTGREAMSRKSYGVLQYEHVV